MYKYGTVNIFEKRNATRTKDPVTRLITLVSSALSSTCREVVPEESIEIRKGISTEKKISIRIFLNTLFLK